MKYKYNVYVHYNSNTSLNFRKCNSSFTEDLARIDLRFNEYKHIFINLESQIKDFIFIHDSSMRGFII